MWLEPAASVRVRVRDRGRVALGAVGRLVAAADRLLAARRRPRHWTGGDPDDPSAPPRAHWAPGAVSRARHATPVGRRSGRRPVRLEPRATAGPLNRAPRVLTRGALVAAASDSEARHIGSG